ncbi:hypothetical protein BH18THE2_BH18THE2_40570 [soil metagenome]
MLAVVGFTMLLSFFTVTSAFAQDRPYSEEHMQLHDGGDRAEYLQEMDHSDPWFYVPPVSDASLSTTYNNLTAN